MEIYYDLVPKFSKLQSMILSYFYFLFYFLMISGVVFLQLLVLCRSSSAGLISGPSLSGTRLYELLKVSTIMLPYLLKRKSCCPGKNNRYFSHKQNVFSDTSVWNYYAS